MILIEEYKFMKAEVPMIEALKKQHFISSEKFTAENIRKLQSSLEKSNEKIEQLEKENQ